MQNIVYYTLKNENIRDFINFHGQELAIKDFRMKVKDRLSLIFLSLPLII